MDELTVDAEHSASSGSWTSAAVVIGVDSVSDCNAPHSGKHKKVQLRAFDVLAATIR
jgi:hypothetical protein